MRRVSDHPGDFHHPGLEGKAALAVGKDLLFLGHPGRLPVTSCSANWGLIAALL